MYLSNLLQIWRKYRAIPKILPSALYNNLVWLRRSLCGYHDNHWNHIMVSVLTTDCSVWGRHWVQSKGFSKLRRSLINARCMLRLKKQLRFKLIVQHRTTRWQHSKDEINAWFLLRIKKWPIKMAVKWHMNITTTCQVTGMWLVLCIF